MPPTDRLAPIHEALIDSTGAHTRRRERRSRSLRDRHSTPRTTPTLLKRVENGFSRQGKPTQRGARAPRVLRQDGADLVLLSLGEPHGFADPSLASQRCPARRARAKRGGGRSESEVKGVRGEDGPAPPPCPLGPRALHRGRTGRCLLRHAAGEGRTHPDM